MIYNKKYIIFLGILILSACKNSSTRKESENVQNICCENSKSKHLLKEIQYTSSFNTLNDSIQCLEIDSNMNMVYIPEGIYSMGASSTNMALKRELPQHQVKVNAFYMDIHEVTNAQFSAFVAATNYKTYAEREIDWEI